MQNADPEQLGTMAAITQVYIQPLQDLCTEISTEDFPVGVACMNSDQQHVISGHRQAVEFVIKKLREWGQSHLFERQRPFS